MARSTKRLRNLQVAEWRREIKKKAIAYRGGACARCGYSRCLDALEFHHKDPGKKDFGVGKYSGGWEKIRQEIEKCDLLCANCHREAHAEAREKEIEQARKELGPKRVRKPNLYVPCGNCGSTVVVFPSRAGRSKRHFCSRDCFLKSQTGRQSAS